MPNLHLEFPVLIGDIGGTNMRFSLILSEKGEQQAIATRQVSDFATIENAINEAILPLAKYAPKSLFLAIAGPVAGDTIKLTNCNWVIRPEKLMREFHFNEVFIINDFEAQALATIVLPEKYLQPIGGQNIATSTCQHEKTKVIIGAGSGLGIAGLVRINELYIPIEGEGGHIDYAPQSEEDLALFPYLQKIVGRVSAEELLSGRGLVNIYCAFCLLRATTPRVEAPEEISSEALIAHDRQAFDAVQFFINYLARLAGDFALIFKAEGGVYIGGGILPEMASLIQPDEFRKNFTKKPPHETILEKIPTLIMTHPRAALVGMESYIYQPRRFLLDQENRFWVNNKK
ncbi:glucokinase [uncultured Bartonella sp.]|uniref:ROK family protein n=1 Tax=uncultured Bartonella sp. TaxID=104108 RepID=UPI00260CFDF7|nr:glucokinase [uncultured Bartonella sp.]